MDTQVLNSWAARRDALPADEDLAVAVADGTLDLPTAIAVQRIAGAIAAQTARLAVALLVRRLHGGGA